MAIPLPTPQSLDSVVRGLRQDRGLTLEALPDEAGINVTYLSDIERGRSNPTLGKLGDLALVFDIRVSEMIAAAEDAAE